MFTKGRGVIRRVIHRKSSFLLPEKERVRTLIHFIHSSDDDEFKFNKYSYIIKREKTQDLLNSETPFPHRTRNKKR